MPGEIVIVLGDCRHVIDIQYARDGHSHNYTFSHSLGRGQMKSRVKCTRDKVQGLLL